MSRAPRRHAVFVRRAVGGADPGTILCHDTGPCSARGSRETMVIPLSVQRAGDHEPEWCTMCGSPRRSNRSEHGPVTVLHRCRPKRARRSPCASRSHPLDRRPRRLRLEIRRERPVYEAAPRVLARRLRLARYSSFLPYYDVTQAGALTWIAQNVKEWKGTTTVPAAFAMFPKDLTSPPREWAERFFDVQRWTEMTSGGHFAALEEPESLARDIREFFRPFRRRTGR